MAVCDRRYVRHASQRLPPHSHADAKVRRGMRSMHARADHWLDTSELYVAGHTSGAFIITFLISAAHLQRTHNSECNSTVPDTTFFAKTAYKRECLSLTNGAAR